jgi:hypothetical protein
MVSMNFPARMNLDGSKMRKSSAMYRRLGRAVLLLCAGFALTAMMTEVTEAQTKEPPAKPSIAGGSGQADQAPLLLHGNYCGPGNRPGPPVDALDTACMHHDACMPSTGLPSCGCMTRLQHEAEAVARNPAELPDIQILATATAAGAALTLCEGSR